jgi:hypothetical protein
MVETYCPVQREPIVAVSPIGKLGVGQEELFDFGICGGWLVGGGFRRSRGGNTHSGLPDKLRGFLRAIRGVWTLWCVGGGCGVVGALKVRVELKWGICARPGSLCRL